MTKLLKMFTEQEHRDVTEAVRTAEAKTSAEIVPVVARSSGRYDRPEDIVGLWVGVLAMAITWSLVPSAVNEPGDWSASSPFLQLLLLVSAMIAGFITGVCLAARLDWLRLLFTSHAQMVEEVELRSRSMFYDRRVHHTAAGSGILIYVSLFERRAAVIADQAVLDALGQPALDAICLQLTNELKGSTVSHAMCQAIITTGDKLAAVLPRQSDDVNELADALVVLD